MDATMVTFQARLATFDGAAGPKSRRVSSRSKKAAPKAKVAWPLSSPSPQDLAYAGFVWKPTSASHDNVQCFSCNCQLDGWEETDVPAYEHLTHSPSCGFAVVTAIRLRHGDPGRTEEDPISDQMIAARQDTFGDLWPLDTAAGFPGVQQLAAAGWFYDPADGMVDGVTCAYCHLSLDAWDSGDDPFEEHRRRAPDCLFFALNELYHPSKPAKKAARVTKPKRASARSSTASNATTTTKPTRGKKHISEDSEDVHFSESVPTKPARGKKRASEAIDDGLEFMEPVAKMPAVRSSAVTKAATKKKAAARTSTVSNAATKKKVSDRSSDVSNTTNTAKTARGKKRTSEAIDDDLHFSESVQESAKRMRFSSMSSLPDDLPVGTPRKEPTEMETEPFTMSSLPPSLLVGTPKRTPSHLREADEADNNAAWLPVDMDVFFNSQQEVRGMVNGVMVDAGLDGLTVAGSKPEEIQAALLASLTDIEKAMTIEQWVLYNAKRGEEKLRMACEQQILAFQVEGKRALDLMEAIPTY
jgi:hypothetical protein